MKKGWLVVNGFLNSAKFSQLYQFFLNAAKQLDVQLEVVPSHRLIATAQEGFCSSENIHFVLFWDKDVCLAQRLEGAGFKLFNCAEAVESCDSKTLTVLKLLQTVPMPQTIFSPKTFPNVGYTNLDFVDTAVETLGLPMIIKESFGSFGEQVYLAKTTEDAKKIVGQLAGKDFLMQKFVAESFGKDVRLNVVGGRVVNAVVRQNLHGDFRSNVTIGGTMTCHEPTELEKEIALKACKKLKLDFAGVDLLLSKDGPLLCEVNSNLHFKSTFDCTGVDLSKEILKHILQQID